MVPVRARLWRADARHTMDALIPLYSDAVRGVVTDDLRLTCCAESNAAAVLGRIFADHRHGVRGDEGRDLGGRQLWVVDDGEVRGALDERRAGDPAAAR